jgi:hypothetical protein
VADLKIEGEGKGATVTLAPEELWTVLYALQEYKLQTACLLRLKIAPSEFCNRIISACDQLQTDLREGEGARQFLGMDM